LQISNGKKHKDFSTLNTTVPASDAAVRLTMHMQLLLISNFNHKSTLYFAL